MTILALSLSLADAMDTRQKFAGGLCAAAVQPGTPLLYQVDNEQWAVYDDHRITLLDAAYGAAFVRHMDDFPPEVALTTLAVRSWLDSTGVIAPDQIDYTADGDPWAETLQANGSPSGLLFAQAVPGNWVRA